MPPGRMRLIVAVVLLALVASCGGEAATETPAPTATPRPTNTALPSDTASPSNTPEPTHTPTHEMPKATSTTQPSNTPQPTQLLMPTPEPLVFSGSGDGTVALDRPAEPALIHITGNAEDRYFSVVSYDSAGQSITTLVRTRNPYDGTRFLDFAPQSGESAEAEHATRLEISAVGAWTIEIWPLSSARTLDNYGMIEGTSDGIIYLDRPREPALVRIVSHSEGPFFGVNGYNEAGELIERLVNTTHAYTGTRSLDLGGETYTVWLEITAAGPWTVEVLPLESGRRLEVPGGIEGSGDDVVLLEGEPDVATIMGNAEKHYFGVTGFFDGGRELLVNTTDVYEGAVVLPQNTFALEIKGTGLWSVAVTER